MRRDRRSSPGAAGRETERAVVYQIAALLLEYPDQALIDRLGFLHEAAATVGEPFRHQLGTLLEHLSSTALPELAADYVSTFDLRRRCCLYLTYYA